VSPALITMDLDGTLEDSRADMVASVQRLRHRLELPERPNTDFWGDVNRGMDHLYRACFAEHVGSNPTTDVLGQIRDAYATDYSDHIDDQTVLYDGWLDTLPLLADIAPLALVTNKPEALSHQLLTALGIREHFTAIIGGDTCAAGKPDPITIATAAQRCGFASDHRPVFHIGDSAGDIRLAHAFGATAIWCAWGYLDAAPTDPAPHIHAPSPQELPTLIQSALPT
jgi:phosphoglycolate phosphatase